MASNNTHCCNECAKESFIKNATESYSNFVNQSNLKHNFFYIYPEENEGNYKNKKSIVKIICPKHGEFTKKAQKHIVGQGCIECVYDNLIESGRLPGGYCEQTFLDNPSLKLVDSVIYYLSINNGKFYKIGITTKKVSDRIKGLKSNSKGYIKNCQIIYEFKNSLYDSYLLEQQILNAFSYARSPRNWSTEIFNEDISQNKKFKEILGIK